MTIGPRTSMPTMGYYRTLDTVTMRNLGLFVLYFMYSNSPKDIEDIEDTLLKFNRIPRHNCNLNPSINLGHQDSSISASQQMLVNLEHLL